MILYLTKLPQPLFELKRGDINDKAFTLVELMMAVAFSALLMTGVFGFYNVANQAYSSGITAQTLQDGANIVLSKIIEGETESNTVYRLATSTSYMLPNGSPNQLYSCGGSPQVSPCNASNSFSELYYCQDSPCSGTNDASSRWYYLNSTGTAVIYHHPASSGGTVDETLYTAPAGSTMKLRFSPAAVNTPLNVVEIDVALTQNLPPGSTNNLLATSGAASTFVLLRNHS